METERRSDPGITEGIGVIESSAAQIAALRDAPAIVDRALELALELTRSRAGFICLNDDSAAGTQLYSRSAGGAPQLDDRSVEAMTGLIAASGASRDARGASHGVTGHLGPLRYLGATLTAGAEPMGLVCVAGGTDYTAADEQALNVLATQVAAAIEIVRLRSHRQEMVDALVNLRADLDRSEKQRLINDERARAAERLEKAHTLAVDALLAVSHHIRSGDSLIEFYRGLTASVAKLVGADRVLFWQLNGDQTLTAIPGAFGVDAAFIARLYPVVCTPGGDDLASQVVYGDLIFRARRNEGSPHQEVLDLLQVTSAISVPWRAGDQRLGIVAAYDSQRNGGFSTEDAWLLQMAGLAAGLVWQMKQAEAEVSDALRRLQRADLARQLLLRNVSTAVDKARRRFASELHDDALQKLTAAELHLQRAREALLEPGVPEAMEQTEQLLQQVEEALRRLLFNVQPPTLDLPGGLETAIRDRLAMLRSLTGIEASVELDLPDELPYEITAAIFRELAEAVTNIEKHAGPTKVDVTLKRRDGGIHGSIVDDGRGFVVSERDMLPGHLGLLALKERALLTGGWCNVTSEPGAGTSVEFWVPVPE